MPRKNKYGDVYNIDVKQLTVELITLPKDVKRSSVKPEINLVRYVIHTQTKHVILHDIPFDTPESARAWFETVKEAFVR